MLASTKRLPLLAEESRGQAPLSVIIYYERAYDSWLFMISMKWCGHAGADQKNCFHNVGICLGDFDKIEYAIVDGEL